MSNLTDLPSDARYAVISILLHWLTVIGVIGLMVSGIIMVDLSYYSAWYTTLPYHHKAFGVLLIGVIAARLIARWTRGVPDPIAKSPLLARFIHSYHGLLYALLALVLFSGYLIPTTRARASTCGAFSPPLPLRSQPIPMINGLAISMNGALICWARWPSFTRSQR